MIWVVGNAGMLGRELCRSLDQSEIENIGSDREVSILDPIALRAFAEKRNPDWIVNCSAYTAVDQAEDDRESAFLINRDGVKNLARLASELNIPIIHMSTDYVFDGTSDIPLTEDSSTGPVGVYGESKLAGEEALRSTWNKHFIIRTAWLYGQFGSNFVYTMIKLMNRLNSIKVVNDQIGSPTWTRDLTELIVDIIRQGARNYGTYHFSGDGECTWFQFAKEIFRIGKEMSLIKSDCQISPCASEEFPTKAKRPTFSLLSKDKVSSAFNYNVKEWERSLYHFLKGINSNDII